MRDLRTILTIASLFSAACEGSAQGPTLFAPASFSPDLVELNSSTPYPATTDNSKTQVFYGATELGSDLFAATEVAFRYDGPLPPTTPGVDFVIDRLIVRVGITRIGTPRGRFTTNLTEPLTTVFDGPRTIRLDESSAAPEPWSPSWTFSFDTPVLVDLRAGGYFVVEFEVRGNGAAGQGHGSLDRVTQSGGSSGGSSVVEGSGCSAGPGRPAATITAFGSRPYSGPYSVFAPGVAYTLDGAGLGADAMAVLLVGLSESTDPALGALPFALTPQCLVQQSLDAVLPVVTDANGRVLAQSDGSFFSVPPRPLFQGMEVFHQFLAYAPPFNPPFGLVATDRVRITLGTFTEPSFPFWMASHRNDPDAEFATDLAPHALAMRIQTL